MSYILQGFHAFLRSANGRVFIEGLIYDKSMSLSSEEHRRFNSENGDGDSEIHRWQIWSNIVLTCADERDMVRACKIAVDSRQFVANESGYDIVLSACQKNVTAAVNLCIKKLEKFSGVIIEKGLLETPGLTSALAERCAEKSDWWFIGERGDLRESGNGSVTNLLEEILINSAAKFGTAK